MRECFPKAQLRFPIDDHHAGESTILPAEQLTARFRLLGILPLTFFLAQAVHYWRIDQLGHMLWMCNMGNLMLAVGLFLDQPVLIRVAVIWSIPGTFCLGAIHPAAVVSLRDVGLAGGCVGYVGAHRRRGCWFLVTASGARRSRSLALFVCVVSPAASDFSAGDRGRIECKRKP